MYDLNHQRSAGNIISENLTQFCSIVLGIHVIIIIIILG